MRHEKVCVQTLIDQENEDFVETYNEGRRYTLAEFCLLKPEARHLTDPEDMRAYVGQLDMELQIGKDGVERVVVLDDELGERVKIGSKQSAKQIKRQAVDDKAAAKQVFAKATSSLKPKLDNLKTMAQVGGNY